MDNCLYLACDIGSKNTKAALGCYNGKAVEIINMDYAPSKGVEKGVIIDSAAVAGVIKDLMYGFEISKNDIDGISFNLSGDCILSNNVSGEYKFDTKSIVTAETLDTLDGIICDNNAQEGKSVMFIYGKKYSLDGENVQAPINRICTELKTENFLFYTDDSQKKALNDIAEMLGIKNINFFPSSVLSAEACLKQNEKDMGCVLVDVGYECTDIAVFSKGSIQACDALPVGMHDIINTLSFWYQVSYDDAEYVFKTYSDLAKVSSTDKQSIGFDEEGNEHWLDIGEYNRYLEDICKQLTVRIVECVAKHGYDNSVFSGYIITGGFAKINGLSKAISECISKGYKVKTGKAYGFAGPEYIIEDPQWFTVLGALKLMTKSGVKERTFFEEYYSKLIIFLSRLFPNKN